MKIVATVILPDSFVSQVQSELDEGTFSYADEIKTRVPEGRKLPDSQAYNLRLKDEATMDALLAEFSDEATLVGAWSEETGEQVRPFDSDLWLEITPDEIELDENDNPVHVRPTEVWEFHKWRNSAPRILS